MLDHLQLRAGNTAPPGKKPLQVPDSAGRSTGSLAVSAGRQSAVSIYLTRIGDILDQGLLPLYERLLSSRERLTYQQFCFDKDRRRFLVTRALVRTVLSRYTRTPPEALVFCTGTYGRPELQSGHHLGAPLRFNLSHTDSLVVLAVTPSRAIGVDAASGSQVHSLHLARRHVLSPWERGSFCALSPAQRGKQLLALWTLKEAYAKARGLGLGLPFTEMTFDLSRDPRVSASFGAGVGDDPAHWNFYLLEAPDDHIVSLCVERGLHPQLPLAACSVIPLVSEEPCVLPLKMATSD